jgi:hypothetical protein
MANITSVSREQDDPSYTGPGLIILIGLVFLLGGIDKADGGFAIFGLAVLALGGYWAYSLEPDYFVRICSAAGESKTLFTKDKTYVEKVVQAINEAIIHRG